MILTSFVVPRRDNANQPFRASDWRQIEERLLAFGGFTYHDGVHGAWQYEGRVYRDESRRFELALGSWRQFPQWLELVLWIRQTFRQDAIYIVVAGIAEILG